MSSSPLRVALLTPTYWPEVRRGSERVAHDLGEALAARGHEVTLITSHDKPATETLEGGMRVIRAKRPPELRRQRWYEYHLGNIPGVVARLVRGNFDVAHAQFSSEAFAAAKARRLGGPPFVFSFHGIATREHIVERRYRLEMLAEATRCASALTALSEPAAAALRRYFLTEAQVLPAGVVTQDFSRTVTRSDRPTLVCAASLGAPHKRGRQLLEGFTVLRGSRPDVCLQLVRTPDPFMSADPLRRDPLGPLPEGVEWVDALDTSALAGILSSAWASVLPSVNEAFGLVALESLAAGTPVAAARSGGIPELLEEKATGSLFTPDDPQDMARAMEEALELGTRDGIEETCRQAASPYDWKALVQRYEDLYEGALEATDG